MSTSSLRIAVAGALVPALFWTFGLLVLPDYAATRDEPESYRAGLHNVRIVRGLLSGRTDFQWPWHELKGYQFVFDTLRGAFGRAVNQIVRTEDRFLGFHAFNLLLSSVALWLLFRLAYVVGESPRVAWLASLLLASTPKFVGHSQNNPKDGIGLFVFCLALLAVCRLAREPGRRPAIWAGLALGVAWASHIIAFLLLPLAALWWLWQGRAPLRERLRHGAFALALGAVVMVLLWPWLWPAPITRLHEILRHVASFSTDFEVLYLGTIYSKASPPFHYFAVSLAVATPLAMLAAIALGLARGHRRTEGRRRLWALAVLWTSLLLVAEMFASSHYDGVRHFLAILPALSILAALGIDELLEGLTRLRREGRGRLAAVLCGALVGAEVAVLWQIRVMHPYQDAYLNEAVNALVPEEAERYFEVEYWGSAYREGAAWINQHAEEGAVIVLPLVRSGEVRYVDARFATVAGDQADASADRFRPRYLMFITRRAYFNELILRVEAELRPVFSIRRRNATLLKIYRIPGRSGIQ